MKTISKVNGYLIREYTKRDREFEPVAEGEISENYTVMDKDLNVIGHDNMTLEQSIDWAKTYK